MEARTNAFRYVHIIGEFFWDDNQTRYPNQARFELAAMILHAERALP